MMIVAIPAMMSNAIPAQKDMPCPLSEVIAAAGTTAVTDGNVGSVTLEDGVGVGGVGVVAS